MRHETVIWGIHGSPIFYPCLLLILLNLPITVEIGEQSIDTWDTGLPLKNKLKGRVYGEANKLDTSRRARYSLQVLSRICRPGSILYAQVCVTESKFGKIDVNPIGNKN